MTRRPILAATGLAVMLCTAAVASGEVTVPSSDVLVGHWLEVRGSAKRAGKFEGANAALVAPERYEILIGTVTGYDQHSGVFRLLGQPVVLTPRTDYRGVTAASLAGARVKVEGRWRGRDEFEARKISTRGPGRDRVAGRVDEVRSTRAGVRVQIMRFSVLLPAQVELDRDELVDVPVAPARDGNVRSGGASSDEDDLFGEGLRLTERLALQGQVGFKAAAEDNFDLDEPDAEDRFEDDASARLRLRWQPGSRVIFVVEGRASERYRDDEEDGSSIRSQLRLGESYALVLDPFRIGLDLQVGRLDFDDEREWIYDQNLDGLRVYHGVAGAQVELSATTTFGEGARLDRESTNLAAYVSKNRADTHFAGWVLHRDADALDAQLTHIGLRAIRDERWLDLSYVSGSDSGVDVQGWGVDVGATFEPEAVEPLSFTVAYAFGSGRIEDGNDGSFRQTGLQDNNGKFAGVTSFRYYGELFEPELSNMHIVTLALGARLARRTSVDLVWHHYRQDQAHRWIRDSEIDDRPDGISTDLGWEVDLVFGDRRWENWDFEVVGSYFKPGTAFRHEDDALMGKLQARFRF